MSIPPIEAMVEKCKAIISDCLAIVKVCQSYVLYCNPYNIADISEKILKVIYQYSISLDSAQTWAKIITRI